MSSPHRGEVPPSDLVSSSSLSSSAVPSSAAPGAFTGPASPHTQLTPELSPQQSQSIDLGEIAAAQGWKFWSNQKIVPCRAGYLYSKGGSIWARAKRPGRLAALTAALGVAPRPNGKLLVPPERFGVAVEILSPIPAPPGYAPKLAADPKLTEDRGAPSDRLSARRFPGPDRRRGEGGAR